MAQKKKSVVMAADLDFFDKLFEPSRRKIEQQLGTKVSQTKFTRMIYRSGMKFDIKLKGVGRNVKKKQKR